MPHIYIIIELIIINVHMILLRGIFIFVAVVAIFPTKGYSKLGGYLNFQFLCYQNPDSLAQDGNQCDAFISKKCDPFFTICINYKLINDDSQSSCPVYYLTTNQYDNVESVCNKPNDNRGALTSISNMELPFPIQESFYVRITVTDANAVSAPQTVAVFTSTFHGTPSPNNEDFNNTILRMDRNEKRIFNPKATLEISMGLKCDFNLYGKHCERFCKASKYDHYNCSKIGTKICHPGWAGPECHVKDLCSYQNCAKNAKCVEINGEPKCMCNGIIGPECYPSFDPCVPNPCLNEGNCTPSSNSRRTAICHCKQNFQGERCGTMSMNLCDLYLCKNNGTCTILSSGKPYCKCQPEYTGILCDLFLVNSTTNVSFPFLPHSKQAQNYGIIFGVLFGLCLLIMSMVAIYFIVTLRRGKVVFTDLNHSIQLKQLVYPSSSSPNEYGLCTDETQYDTIQDRTTYVYQLDSNDDYLVPSNLNTPVLSPSNTSGSSGYIPMFSNDFLYSPDTDLNDQQRESVELPPLPTRNSIKPSRRFFKSFKK